MTMRSTLALLLLALAAPASATRGVTGQNLPSRDQRKLSLVMTAAPSDMFSDAPTIVPQDPTSNNAANAANAANNQGSLSTSNAFQSSTVEYFGLAASLVGALYVAAV